LLRERIFSVESLASWWRLLQCRIDAAATLRVLAYGGKACDCLYWCRCTSLSALCPVASFLKQELTMNKDQVKGKAREVGGKVQQEVGKLVGSTEQQAKGLNQQAAGKLQKGLGDAKEAVKDVIKGNRN
jgi:uncharacterized protein YjbJ (UPF0337 family)